ncbi:hypothetical protein F5879DRAFT_766891, partial [Lentinula edodes]
SLEDTKRELAQYLNRFQRHTRCTAGYCLRRNKETGQLFCRFGFPWKERVTSEYVRDPGRDFAEFHTRRNDPLLNSYNAAFTLGWRANVDIQPVINKEA